MMRGKRDAIADGPNVDTSFSAALQRFAEHALQDPTLELELAVDFAVSANMFRTLLRELCKHCEPEECVQVDVPFKNVRFEYRGDDAVRKCLSADPGATPTCVVMKRRETPVVSSESFPYVARLKRETVVTEEYSQTRIESVREFRLKRRFTFRFDDAFRVDCTFVQQRRPGQSDAPMPLTYEIEVELLNDDIDAINSKTRGAECVAITMTAYIANCIRILGSTSELLTRTRTREVLASLHGAAGGFQKRSGLPGPQPVPLELSNVQPPDEGSFDSIWNGNYAVTDKADGSRCQMMVFGQNAYTCDALGAVRLVVKNVPIDFDGSWADGELITRDAGGAPRNTFACFDVYRFGDRDVSNVPLLEPAGGESRIHLAQRLARALSFGKAIDNFEFRVKDFLMVDRGGSAIRTILDATSYTIPYDIDGLVFTPIDAPVGGRHRADEPQINGTWFRCFKWKPPSHTTIDFLVRATGANDRASTPGGSAPFDVFANYVPRDWEPVDVSRYLQFGSNAIPSGTAELRRFDAADGAAASMLAPIDSRGVAVCEDGLFIQSETVVECSFRDGFWRPMRNRNDKSAPNNWRTAIGVWRSIVAPVTDDIVRGTKTPPPAAEAVTSTDVYYARRNFERSRSLLSNMTSFHNLCVKDYLYERASSLCATPGSKSLFEIACGKGGDMPRWIKNGFDPVVGIDVSLDNIVNATDGIYCRMAQRGAELAGKTYAFACMSASVRMTPPLDEVRVAAMDSPHGDVIERMWGLSETQPGNASTGLDGVCRRPFDIVSCQFAIHYLFESDASLSRLVHNVSHMCAPGGVFIGTCFDGDKLAAELDRSPRGSIVGSSQGVRVWEISKRYDGRFSGGTGHAIDVYIETINRTVCEYLVSPRTLRGALEVAGFCLIQQGAFNITRNADDTNLREMTAVERALSSRYMFFIYAFDQMRNPDTTRRATSAAATTPAMKTTPCDTSKAKA
jgi:hypothetical protein